MAPVLTAVAFVTPSLADPILEPTTQSFLNGLVGGDPSYTLTPDAARQVFLDVQSGPGGTAPSLVHSFVWR